MATKEEPAHTMIKSELSYEDESKVREEAELLMKPQANWEKFLLPAPTTVALLGQLVCIPVERGDFSIFDNSPSSGYSYFGKTESFTVCLKDVYERVWDAFQLGRIKAKEISFQLKDVPQKMENLIQGFLQDANIKRDQLLVQIEGMQRKVKKCKTLAEEMEDKFKKQEDVFQELSQACLNAKQGKNKVLETVQKEMKKTESQMKPVRNELDHLKQKQEQLKTHADEALKSFMNAIEKRPSALDGFSMEKDMTHFMEEHSTKVKGSKEMHGKAWQEVESNYERMKVLTKNITEIQCAMHRCENNERELKGCISSLERALETLENMQQQWKKMVEFFQMIWNLVVFCLNGHIKGSLDSREDLLRVTQVVSAVNVAQLVQLISETYVKIVQEYLKQPLMNVGRLLIEDQSSFHTEKAQLDRGCKDAREALTTLVGEKKGNFQSDLSMRLETIKKMKSCCTPEQGEGKKNESMP